MSDRKDQQPNSKDFSVDDILAEYGSRSKVIEFPQNEEDLPDDPMPRPARKPAPVDEDLKALLDAPADTPALKV